ncbi:MAG: Holliday junction branch migration DNA helicase RuvB [Planctomycetaceae bacterium]|nr:Holliday junction ATP-dependent DNA helicase RuvB [Planctomycetota bacterium]NUO15329.1 Holliday junction branch migration DNA helicase RuvB [Planctomycetaceae bacterium]HRJ77326.1 Holliday junction branch migration DNA helicase RuvB [Planctomycetota bacterium]
MTDSVYERESSGQERDFELSLRPKRLAEFIGQRPVVENLSVYISAARKREEPLDHILFSGMPGLGKTTLANLIATELGANMHASSGPALERAGDLVGLLTNLEQGDVLFIDEIHRLPAPVEEFLYSAMEDFHVDIQIDQGPAARSVRVNLKHFTLVGATTREGLLSAPFRARFGVFERLDPYPAEDILQIVTRSARLLDLPMDAEAAALIAARSRGTPRVANRILRRLRDVAQVRGKGRLTLELAEQGLRMLGIDAIGLTELDRRILRVIAEQGGGPIGLKTIAVAVGEEEDTIEDAYEPHLIREGLLQKTPRGRKLTDKASALLAR